MRIWCKVSESRTGRWFSGGLSCLRVLDVVGKVYGLLAPISSPNLSFTTRKADRLMDRCNAENIMLAYTTGVAAGVVV
jgi:hypothetical protein